MRTTIQYTMVFAMHFCLFAILSAQETGAKKRHRKAPPPVADSVDAVDMKKESEALEFLRHFSPQKAEKLQELKTVNEREYRIQMSRAIREMRRAEALKERNPEHYERMVKIRLLEERSRELRRNYRDAGDAEKTKIESELRKLLGELFDLREENRQEEVKRLEKRLQELKKSLNERRKNKALIVERRLAKLTGKSKQWEWD